MNRDLYIIASRFRSITGGLIWTSRLAEYAKRIYRNTTLIDLEQENILLRTDRFLEIIYYFIFLLFKNNFFVFIDHRLHLRFGIPLLASLLLKKNMYATICHHLFYKTKKCVVRKAIEYFSEKIFLKNARFIIVPSNQTALDIQSICGARDNIIVIHPTYTVKCRGFPQRQFRNRILFVGNLEPRKGIQVVIEALSLINDTDFSFDIVGGYYKHEKYFLQLKNLVNKHDLSNRITFHGRVDSNKLVHFYRSANVFVFPSWHEGYGIVLLEAMNFGLPIVATDIPTTRDIIRDDVNGYLCPVNDAKCMARKIRKLLSNHNIQTKIGKTNYKASRKFRNWVEVVEQTFNTIRPYLICCTNKF